MINKDENKIGWIKEVLEYPEWKNVIRAREVLPALEDDLKDVDLTEEGETYKGIELICTLIAIAKSETGEKIRTVTGKKSSNENVELYRILNEYFYKDKGIRYDESSEVSKVLSEFEYKLLWNGDSSFQNITSNLSSALKAGKSYILGIEGHTVAVDMKKDLNPGDALTSEAEILNYMTFKRDPLNYNTTDEYTKNVHAIFGK